MKNILFTVLTFVSLTLMAQVPQGVGYQGVATDSEGIELVNQSISIKASILSGSANGNVEWEETHATTTDAFGLFALTIGQGTSTGSGAQSSFEDISWGTNTHFLKIEMDATGGNNYSFMGTNQMMSVPYALYAESANINYDSISNFLSGDSAFITNVGSGIGGDGCDILFPDGLEGDFISIDILQGNYTVPSGKNLYILNAMTDVGQQIINLDGKRFIKYDEGYWQYNTETVMAGSGSVLSNQYQSSSGIQSSTMFGYLVDENYFAGCGGGGSSSATSSLDSTTIANMIAAAGGGCVSFGEITPLNITVTQYGTHPTVEYQATEDGFLSGQVYLYGSNAKVRFWSDTVSGHTTLRAHFKNSTNDNGSAYQSFNIPVKSGDYYYFTHFGNASISNEIFIPLECAGGSSSASSGLDSATVAIMIANAISNSVSIGVGDYYGGGVVIHIFMPGETGYVSGETHGIIAYHNNVQLEWGCSGVTTGINNLGIGQGIVNTQNLVNTCSELNFAAKYCDDLVVGPYNDWYLPNFDEFDTYCASTVWSTWNISNVWVSEEYDPNIAYFANNHCGVCSPQDHAYQYNGTSTRYLNGKDLTTYMTGSTPYTIAFRQF